MTFYKVTLNSKMTLKEAAHNQGLIESKEINKLMASYKRRWNKPQAKCFPAYTGQSTAQYVAQYLRDNHLKMGV